MSSNYLPDVTMPPPEPIEIQEDDPLVSRADDDEGSVTISIEDTVTDDEIIEEEPEPVVKPKKKLKNEDIFKTPKVQPIKEPEKEKKKRKPTERQLKALADAREKMKAKREETKKLKEEGKDVPKSKKQLKQEEKVKEVIKEQGRLYTQEEISKMVEAGIQKYDLQRKARKEIKKVRQQEEEQQAKVRQTLNRALGQGDPNDIFAYALKGMWGGV